MPFEGVSCPNSLVSSRIEIYVELLNSGLSVAVPKYSFPAALASSLSCAEERGMLAHAASRRNGKRILRFPATYIKKSGFQ